MFHNIWVWLAGSLVTAFMIAKSVLLCRIRLRRKDATKLYELVAKQGKTFILCEEIGGRSAIPSVYSSLCSVSGILFHFSIDERFMHTGHESVEIVSHITLLRFQRKKAIKLLEHSRQHSQQSGAVPIYLVKQWDAEHVGELDTEQGAPAPYMESGRYIDIEHDIDKVVKGTLKKSGAILHGMPGNGKSYLIRYFAIKYNLSIWIVSFAPDMDNHDVIKMFCRIKGPAIIVMEDFDSYFNGRKCVMKGAQFTFDTILNVLDGAFSSYNQLFFFMTANDITRIDPALRSRPSRFRFVREIPNPSRATRMDIFKGLPNRMELVELTHNLNLDRILMVKNSVEEGRPIREILLELAQESDYLADGPNHLIPNENEAAGVPVEAVPA